MHVWFGDKFVGYFRCRKAVVFYKNKGSNIEVVHKYSFKKLTTEDLTIRNAPVGGHTCLTAGEQGEPAVVLYERINLSVFVPLLGGRAKNLRRGYQEDPQHLDLLQITLSYPVVVGPPTGTDRETRLLSLIRRFTAFTRGYASVPSYGGNACINSIWGNCYIIA